MNPFLRIGSANPEFCMAARIRGLTHTQNGVRACRLARHSTSEAQDYFLTVGY
jgi:hypothetical protein